MENEWLTKVEYGNFSLKKFCDHAAQICKILIQLRERDETGFLGNESAYADWKLNEFTDSQRGDARELRRVELINDLIQHQMVGMGGSGGSSHDDPLGEFKGDVSVLVNHSKLQAAIEAADNERPIAWDGVANWESLPTIRQNLTETYQRLDAIENSDTIPSNLPVAESARVKLFRFKDVPVAFIDNEPINSLTRARYNVVSALLKAGEGGYTKDELDRVSGHSDAQKMLTGLCKSDDRWGNVISFPGKGGAGGYRIS